MMGFDVLKKQANVKNPSSKPSNYDNMEVTPVPATVPPSSPLSQDSDNEGLISPVGELTQADPPLLDGTVESIYSEGGSTREDTAEISEAEENNPVSDVTCTLLEIIPTTQPELTNGLYSMV